MKIKNLISLLVALLLTLALGCAAAEELPGNVPSRGLSFPMTQADVDMGLVATPYVATYDENGVPNSFAVSLAYVSPRSQQAQIELDNMYKTGDFSRYDEMVMETFYYTYVIGAYYIASGEEAIAALKACDPDVELVCENDGYTYFLATDDLEMTEGDDAALFEAAYARMSELLQQVTFQPVVLSEYDLMAVPQTAAPNAFPEFETKLLTGEAVDNSIFAQKDLTVVNIWGTTCGPCIMEMPELQAWNEEMPENVQIMGLISDVEADNEEDMETAQFICESTGVNYPNMTNCEGFADMLAEMPFTPTTIFVDRSGAIVGEPICGAYVDQYKEFVNEYLGAM